jgi:hemolysin activation/secretion protein
VIALRVAGGWEDNNATSEFEVGGRNGTLLNVVPGLSVGNLTQMFFVRGFAPGTQNGTRALSGSAEYRLPLAIAARGWGLLPVFLGKTSLTMFYDAGEAWCPLDHGAVPIACSPGDVSRYLLSAAGAELAVDAALQYDVPYRFRFGLAAPVTNRERYGASVVTPYVSFGLSF